MNGHNTRPTKQGEQQQNKEEKKKRNFFFFWKIKRFDFWRLTTQCKHHVFYANPLSECIQWMGDNECRISCKLQCIHSVFGDTENDSTLTPFTESLCVWFLRANFLDHYDYNPPKCFYTLFSTKNAWGNLFISSFSFLFFSVLFCATHPDLHILVTMKRW